VKFDRIPFTSLDVDIETLSQDQKILLHYTLAKDSGDYSSELARMKPGKVAHSRRLTTAARILRLYMSVDKPPSVPKTMATYVMKVYVPVWFVVKCRPTCICGSRYLFELIKRSRYLPKNVLQVVDVAIQKNGYFGHCENIILAMLFDER